MGLLMWQELEVICGCGHSYAIHLLSGTVGNTYIQCFNEEGCGCIDFNLDDI